LTAVGCTKRALNTHTPAALGENFTTLCPPKKKKMDPKKTSKVPSIPIGSLLSFYCQFFTTHIIGGAKDLVVLL